MRVPTPAFLLAFVLVAVACDEPDRMVLEVPESQTTAADPVQLVDCVPAAISEDRAMILEAAVDDDLLRLRVEYSGGCETHLFALHASRCFLESIPVQSDLFLEHDDADDPCDTVVEQELVFDLTSLKQEYVASYHGGGAILLRIYPPGIPEYLRPRPLYEFERPSG